MGANDGAVDHQILVVAIGGQRLEHPLPNPGVTPAAEATVYRLPFSVAFRQVAPMRPGAQDPQTSVDEQAVIDTRPPRLEPAREIWTGR